MGLLKAFTQLLDENSGTSFDKIIVSAIDKVEDTLNQTLDKAEAGAKKIEQAGKKVEHVSKTVENSAGKFSDIVAKRDESAEA